MFTPSCLPILIGSLPLTDHLEAMKIILSHSPQIPLWPQLPKLPGEGMVRQFLSGFPGLREEDSRCWVDNQHNDFESEMTSFYQDYLQVSEDTSLLQKSRFGLKSDNARGFATFTNYLRKYKHNFITLKGQITGPITAGLGVTDLNNRAIFHDANLRDMLIKLLTLKGRWQVEEMRQYTDQSPPIVFIDEPGFVSFGSPALMGISRDMVSNAMEEVINGIQTAGGLAGVHICANGDWGPVLQSKTDIISFDAYFYFDNFILYKDQLIDFLQRGGILAWGIIPTGDPLVIEKESNATLFHKWLDQLEILSSLGFPKKQLMEQTFIAPSCGTGSLTLELALKVLGLTGEVSRKAQEFGRSL